MDINHCDDQEARDAIRTKLNLNFFVEAGAGSGKTTAMVGRMLSLVESQTCELSEICAITFTNQAADHLKKKFQEVLENRIAECQSDQNAFTYNHLEKAYQNIHHIFIGTIHSFCLLFLKEHSLELGLESSFTLLESHEEEKEKRLFWNRYLSHVWKKNSSQLEYFVSLNLQLDLLEDVFVFLCSYEDVDFSVQKKSFPDITSAFQKMFDWMEEYRYLLPAPPQAMDGLSRMWHKIYEHHRIYQGDIPFNVQIDTLIRMSHFGKLKTVQKLWPSPKKAKKFVNDSWIALQEDWLNVFVEEVMSSLYSDLIPFMMSAVSSYRKHRMDEQRLSMSDLLMCVRDILRENATVRQRWKKKIKSILVDEFQDTDLLQTQILFYLSGIQDNEKNWKKIVPDAGRFFVVGDPKQSIYRFRRADIQLYYMVKDILLQSGGYVCELHMNFRSHQEMAKWINHVFDEKSFFPREKSCYQAHFMPMTCYKQGDSQDAVVALRVPSDKTKVSEKVLEQAQIIARFIRKEVHEKNYSYRDFMILGYYGSNLSVYENILDDHNIPSLILGKRKGNESVLLRDLLRMFEWMLNPKDEFLGYGVLRSLLFGLSDLDLLHYRFKKKCQFILKSQSGDDAVCVAMNQIWKWYGLLRQISSLELLFIVFREWKLMDLARNICMSDVESNILALFLNYASSLNKDSCLVLTDLIDVFHCFIDTKSKPLHGYDSDKNDSVRILNIHQAKGLEAKIVFLVDLARLNKKKSEIFIDQSEGSPKGLFSFFNFVTNRLRKKLFVQPWQWSIYEQENHCFTDSEQKRLLYVACTRAKDRLIVTDDKKSAWGDLSPFLEECVDLTALSHLDDDSQVVRKDQKTVFEGFSFCKKEIEKLSIPSHRCMSVTQENVFDFVSKGQTGLGIQFGIWMHHLLEIFVTLRKSLCFDIKEFIATNDRSGQSEESLRQIEIFRESNLWQSVMRSSKVYTEVPYAMYSQQKTIDVQTGVIDLIFWEEGAWILVDYKTEGKKGLDLNVLKMYRQQISKYSESWTEITKACVKKSFLYFTSCGTIVE